MYIFLLSLSTLFFLIFPKSITDPSKVTWKSTEGEGFAKPYWLLSKKKKCHRLLMMNANSMCVRAGKLNAQQSWRMMFNRHFSLAGTHKYRKLCRLFIIIEQALNRKARPIISHVSRSWNRSRTSHANLIQPYFYRYKYDNAILLHNTTRQSRDKIRF